MLPPNLVAGCNVADIMEDNMKAGRQEHIAQIQALFLSLALFCCQVLFHMPPSLA